MTVNSRRKFLWFTDSHLMPWNRRKMLNTILDERPAGIFHTGDISNFGITLASDLEFLGKRIGRPMHFVLGNHCCWGSSFAATSQKVRAACAKYPNLIWMSDAGIVPLNEEACVIGAEGWYSCEGNTDYLKYTFDWFLIDDFERLPNMKARIEAFRWLAEESAVVLGERLERAVEEYKTVYLLSHFPAWNFANRCDSLLSEAFWEPYNTNIPLGKVLEKVMSNHKKRRLIAFMGHTHKNVSCYPTRNIECRVGAGSYYKVSNDEIIYL